MGNAFKLLRNWISSQSDDCANNMTPICDGNSVSFHQTLSDTALYSWNRATAIEASQFRLKNLNGQHIYRAPPNQGQQFIIEKCKRSLIIVAGSFDSIIIDDCSDCKIILGPARGSVFLRNSIRCLIVTACGQFRTRDCHDVACYIFCVSQPSIETSYMMKFQCISLDYPGHRDDFVNAKLNATIANRWSEIFDFTPTSVYSNWKLLPVEDCVEDHLDEPELMHCINHQIAFSRTNSLIPFIHPASNAPAGADPFCNTQWDLIGKF